MFSGVMQRSEVQRPSALPTAPLSDATREEGLSLQAVLDVPFVSDARAAPAGDQAAWVVNRGGCRNIWVSERAGQEGQLTHYVGDNGVALSQLRWTPACDAIVYTLGPLPNDEEPPFPAQPPSGMEAPQLWLAPLDGTPARWLARGQSPEVSPRGDRVAYLVEGRVWTVPLRGEPTPQRLVADRGVCGALAWSPDSRRLAFVSDRGGQAYIGVHDLTAQSTTWMAPGVDRDGWPVWSPDGQRIAFIRLAEPTTPTYTGRPEGQPWSLWVGDVASGTVRCLWTAPPGAGSVFAALPSGPQLLWAGEDRLVFPWEGSGWRHLCAVSADVPTEAEDLTPGAFEVFAMALDAPRRALVCAANKDNLDGRHLWRVGLNGTGMVAITSGDTVEDAPSLTASGDIIALQSDARTPVRPVRIGGDGAVYAMAVSTAQRGLAVARLVVPQLVSFRAQDGLEIQAQLFLPPAGAARWRAPAIVYFHGGPARQMLPAWHTTEIYHLHYGLNQYLASRGYLVLSVNYRGGTGYGLGFREPPGLGAGGASEYQDAAAAAAYLRARADVDPARIAAYGTSYGGLMTALALSRVPDLFSAGVDCAGVSDWSPAFSQAGASADVVAAAFAASPMASLAQWRAPVLFIHADDDRTVPFSQTVGIVKALRRRGGVQVEHLVLPDEQHDFLRHRSWQQTLEATVDSFDRTLV
jgi:dipeptidyl aminopeptidase/acylaminoacyl peptidase